MISVPLWLAVTLKKSKKCHIKLPDWMQESELKNILKEEKANEGFYHGLPFYYREISKIIFDIDAENMNHKNIRILIQDIEDVRESKTKRGLKSIQPSTYIVHLNNISSNQLNKNIRINVGDLLHYFHDITRIGPNADQISTQNQSQSTLNQSSLMNTTITTDISSINPSSQPQSNMYSQSQQENNFNSSNISSNITDLNGNSQYSQNGNRHSQPMRKLRRLR